MHLLMDLYTSVNALTCRITGVSGGAWSSRGSGGIRKGRGWEEGVWGSGMGLCAGRGACGPINSSRGGWSGESGHGRGRHRYIGTLVCLLGEIDIRTGVPIHIFSIVCSKERSAITRQCFFTIHHHSAVVLPGIVVVGKGTLHKAQY